MCQVGTSGPSTRDIVTSDYAPESMQLRIVGT